MSKTVDDASTPRRIEVQLQPTYIGFRGRLVVRDATGFATTREIETSSCAEAVEGLALIVALLFDPESAKSEPAPPAPPAESKAVERRVVEEERGRSTHFALSTSFLVASGQAPNPALGADLGLSLEALLIPQIVLLVRAGVRLTAPETVSSSQGVATFGWWAAFASACPVIAPHGNDSYVYGLCLTAEQGIVEGTGSETTNPRTAGRSWTALGPGFAMRWLVMPPLFLSVTFDVVFPFRRDRFLLGIEQIHEVPALATQGGFGIGVRF